MDYGSFVNESLKKFRELPEETSELYKKDFISIPLEYYSFDETVTDAKEVADATSKTVGEKFDLIVYGNGACTSDCKYVSTCPMSRINVEKRMIKSDSSRIAAFVNANGRNAINIDIPSGINAKISVLFAGLNGVIGNIFVNVGSNAHLELNELYVSRSERKSVLAAAHEIAVEDNASLSINAIHNEDRETFSLNITEARAGANSRIKSNSVYVGSAYTKAKTLLQLNGEGSYGDFRESMLTSQAQKLDIETEVNNIGKRSEAKLESRAVLMDSSMCYMKGFARLSKGAKGAISDVTEKCIKLDRSAIVKAMPDMSIEENDVKAKHASSTDLVEGDKLFYLLSRGMTQEDARQLIVEGFLNANMQHISDERFRNVAATISEKKAKTKEFGSIDILEEVVE